MRRVCRCDALRRPLLDALDAWTGSTLDWRWIAPPAARPPDAAQRALVAPDGAADEAAATRAAGIELPGRCCASLPPPPGIAGDAVCTGPPCRPCWWSRSWRWRADELDAARARRCRGAAGIDAPPTGTACCARRRASRADGRRAGGAGHAARPAGARRATRPPATVTRRCRRRGVRSAAGCRTPLVAVDRLAGWRTGEPRRSSARAPACGAAPATASRAAVPLAAADAVGRRLGARDRHRPAGMTTGAAALPNL